MMSLKEKYQNGKIPKKALKPIDSGHLLEENARDSYMRMKAEAKKDNVDIVLPYKTSAYRPCGEKGDYTQGLSKGLFTQWYAWEKYKAGQGNLASNPTTSKGCSSNHGWGIAIDVKGKKAQDWIKENGEKFGWWWSGGTFRQIEDWHFDYDIKRDTLHKKKGSKIFLYASLGLVAVGLGVGLYYFIKTKK